MKKVLALVVSVSMMVSLCGCSGSDSEAVFQEPTEITTEKALGEASGFLSVYKKLETDFDVDGPTVYCYGELEKVYLSEEDGIKYPKLKNALDEFNSENANSWEESVEHLRSLVSDMQEMGSSSFPLEDKNSLSVQRADDKVLSLMTYSYIYSGGAHGYYSHGGVSFDVETGKVLTLGDIFKNTSGICEIIIGKLKEKYTDMDFYGLEETIENSYNVDALSFFVGYQGVTFCFSPYHLGSFADGEQFVTIYYDEYPDLFYEKYTNVPSSYVIGEVVSIDMNGDFKGDEFYAHPTYEGAFYIYADGKEYRDEGIYFDGVDCYIICDDGKYYVYTELTQEDWKISILYAITQSGIEKAQILDGTGLGWENVEGEYCKKIPCDAKNILLKTGENTISLKAGNRNYFIDSDTGLLIAHE